jgi:hypothetical protein
MLCNAKTNEVAFSSEAAGMSTSAAYQALPNPAFCLRWAMILAAPIPKCSNYRSKFSGNG